MTQTILLTGITGFIAKQIAHDLLEKGYHVRGSLRSLDRSDEVRAAIAPQDADRLEFVALDLTQDDGWTEAMDGVDALVHTASPFPMAQPENEDDLIRPAVDGTLRALKAAQAAGVHRVVLTASMVTIMHKDHPPGYVFGPEDWSEPDHKTISTYGKSKTLAEKAAWDFVAQHPEMHLTTIHPGLVAGIPRDAHFGTSLGVIERILSGKDPMQPDIRFPLVDLADVSALHVAALENDQSKGQRVIAAAGTSSMPEMASLFAEEFPDKKISRKTAPKLLLRLLALFDSSIKTVITDIGREFGVDPSSATRLLNRDLVSADEAALRSARYLARAG